MSTIEGTTMSTDSPHDQTGLITPDQAAAMLAVAPRTLADWRRAGIGPAYLRLSERKFRYRESTVRAYLAAAERVPGLADTA